MIGDMNKQCDFTLFHRIAYPDYSMNFTQIAEWSEKNG